MRKLGWLIAAVVAVTCVGCNTVEGVGEDIQAAGEAVEDAAADASDEEGGGQDVDPCRHPNPPSYCRE